MTSLHAPIHTTRVVFGALAVVVLLAAATAVAAAEPLTSDKFAPGWQSHARPLFYMGPSLRASGRDKFMMPGILERGDYVLVRRKGDKAEVIRDAAVITVHGGSEKQYVFLDGGGDVEALPVADVPELKATAATR